MSGNSKEVNLDAKSVFIPKSISDILEEVSMIQECFNGSSKLDFYLSSLEDEMRKVDAFKRELPYCMHLLNDVIEILKKERLRLKGDDEEGRAKGSIDISQKRNWMSAVQLWSTPIQYEHARKKETRDEEEGVDRHFRNNEGTFVPFRKEEKTDLVFNGLSLSIYKAETETVNLNTNDFVRAKSPQPQQRKQRRCWSPGLHKRFVDALQFLGGPQTATPKQIRALMKVEGLTNDEVKSHLQKYRLHIRKLPSSSSDVPIDYSWLTENQVVVGHAGSGSPQDHLQQQGGTAKVASARVCDSMEEDEDDKSESRSWKGKLQRLIE